VAGQFGDHEGKTVELQTADVVDRSTFEKDAALAQSILTRLQGLLEKQARLDEVEKEQKRVAGNAEKTLDRLEAAIDNGSLTAATTVSPLLRWTPLGCRNKQLGTGESDVDCGGKVCNKCVNGKKCSESSDCTSLKCDEGKCTDSRWQSVTERMNLLCDTLKDPATGSLSKPVYEGGSKGEGDCADKCAALAKAQGAENCAFMSYWPETKWCRLTSTCSSKSADAHKVYEVNDAFSYPLVSLALLLHLFYSLPPPIPLPPLPPGSSRISFSLLTFSHIKPLCVSSRSFGAD
jgi:hypothetical protein